MSTSRNDPTYGGASPRRRARTPQPPTVGSRSPALQQALAGGGGPGTGSIPGLDGGTQQPGQQGQIDLSGDPILQRIRALNLRAVQGAEADDLAGRKQALLGFGYDQSLQGLYPDESTAEAARQNPFSVLANLLYEHQQGAHNIDEEENRQNLFYSGHRANRLGEEARGYQAKRAGAFGGLQGNLSQLGSGLLAAQQYANDQETQALSDAYARYHPSDVGTAPPSGVSATPRAQIDALAPGQSWQNAQTYAGIGATPEAIPGGNTLMGPTVGPQQSGTISSSMGGQSGINPLAKSLTQPRRRTYNSFVQ